MACKVFGAVLTLAINSLVQILHDFDTRRLCVLEMRVHIIDEYGQALRLATGLRWASTSWPRAVQHDPGIAEMHLRAFDPPARFAVPVVLAETERFRKPKQCIGDILICDMRKNGICRYGTVLQHEPRIYHEQQLSQDV